MIEIAIGKGFSTVRDALARELVKVVYVIWAKGLEYQETPPPRPGSRRERMREMLTGTPRPGTGQPYQPMAGVQ